MGCTCKVQITDIYKHRARATHGTVSSAGAQSRMFTMMSLKARAVPARCETEEAGRDIRRGSLSIAARPCKALCICSITLTPTSGTCANAVPAHTCACNRSVAIRANLIKHTPNHEYRASATLVSHHTALIQSLVGPNLQARAIKIHSTRAEYLGHLDKELAHRLSRRRTSFSLSGSAHIPSVSFREETTGAEGSHAAMARPADCSSQFGSAAAESTPARSSKEFECAIVIMCTRS